MFWVRSPLAHEQPVRLLGSCSGKRLGLLWWLLGGIRRYQSLYRWALLVLSVLALVVFIYLETPLSGLIIVFLWIIYSFYGLFQPDVREVFGAGGAAGVRDDAARETAD